MKGQCACVSLGVCHMGLSGCEHKLSVQMISSICSGGINVQSVELKAKHSSSQ